MADLELDISSNLKEIAADVKRLNKNFEETGDKADKAGKKAKNLGDQMSGAAIGGAIQAGISKVLSDLDKSSLKAKTLADSLRTLRFLTNEAGVAQVRALAPELAKQGIQPEQIGPTAANVRSIAGEKIGDAGVAQILKESAFAQGGGVGSFDPFAEAVTLGSIQREEFTSAKGITGISNVLTQGIVEARLKPEDVGKQAKSLVIGLGAGLSVAETIAAFSILTKQTGSADDANAKLKITTNLWIKTGAKGAGVSFIAYLVATAGKTDADLTPEELTESGIIRGVATQEIESGAFTGAVGRISAAQADPKSRARGAFQKQMRDKQTRLNIENEEQEALRKLNAAGEGQRGGTEAGKDLVEAAVAAYFGAGKFVHSLNPLALLETGASEISGGAIPDVGGVLRSSASQDAVTVSNALSFATRALNNSTKVTSQADGNLKLKDTEVKP